MTVRVRTEIHGEDKTRAAFRSVEASLSRMRTAFGAVAGVTAALGIGRFVGDALQSADAVNKLSDRLGASTQVLSEYQFVAERTGVSQRELANGFQRMARNVSEAAREQGAAVDVLRELGLEAGELTKLELDQQFEILADAMEGVTNESDKVRIAQKLFGRQGVALIQTMKGGSAAIGELRQQARELGLSLSEDAADGASDAIDAWTDLKSSTQALGLTLVEALGPALADVAGWLSDAIPTAVDAAGSALDTLRAFVARTAARFTGFFADIQAGYARVAEFFGADDIAEQFRGAAELLDETSGAWERAAARFESADAERAETTVEAIQKSVDYQSLYNEELAKSASVTKSVAEAEKSRADQESGAAEARLESIARYVDALQTEADTLGLTNTELVEYQLNKLKASQATIDQAVALQEEIEAFEAIAEVERENARIMERSNELQKRGAKEVKDEWQSTSTSIQDGFLGAIEGAESFQDVLDGLKSAFIDLAKEQIKTLFQPSPGPSGAGAAAGGGGALLPFLASFLPGFAAGGRATGPHIVGERGPEIRFPSENVSNVLRVSVDVGGGNAFANQVTQSQFATELGNVISQNLSRNG